jgi:hypothetical protein
MTTMLPPVHGSVISGTNDTVNTNAMVTFPATAANSYVAEAAAVDMPASTITIPEAVVTAGGVVKKTQASPRMTVVTVCTEKSAALSNWELALQHHGYTHVKVLGMGKVRQGCQWRVKMYLRCLKRLLTQYGENHIVLMCNATDVLSIQSQDTLLKQFVSLQQTVVVSSDDCDQRSGQFFNKMSLPLVNQVITKRLGSDVRYKWIHGGISMGYLPFMIELYQRVQSYQNEQEGLQMEWLVDPDVCWVDHQQLLFGTMIERPMVKLAATTADMEYDDEVGKWKQVHTHTYPCFVHLQSESKPRWYNAFLRQWQQAEADMTNGQTTWHRNLQHVSSHDLQYKEHLDTSLCQSDAVECHSRRRIAIGSVMVLSVLIGWILWKWFQSIKQTRRHPVGIDSSLASMAPLVSSWGPNLPSLQSLPDVTTPSRISPALFANE